MTFDEEFDILTKDRTGVEDLIKGLNRYNDNDIEIVYTRIIHHDVEYIDDEDDGTVTQIPQYYVSINPINVDNYQYKFMTITMDPIKEFPTKVKVHSIKNDKNFYFADKDSMGRFLTDLFETGDYKEIVNRLKAL